MVSGWGFINFIYQDTPAAWLSFVMESLKTSYCHTQEGKLKLFSQSIQQSVRPSYSGNNLALNIWMAGRPWGNIVVKPSVSAWSHTPNYCQLIYRSQQHSTKGCLYIPPLMLPCLSGKLHLTGLKCAGLKVCTDSLPPPYPPRSQYGGHLQTPFQSVLAVGVDSSWHRTMRFWQT